MPRPKGSRNRTKPTLDEQIQAAQARVEQLRGELAEAETALKALEALRDEAQVQALMGAIAASGRSIGDVIAMVKGETDA